MKGKRGPASEFPVRAESVPFYHQFHPFSRKGRQEKRYKPYNNFYRCRIFMKFFMHFLMGIPLLLQKDFFENLNFEISRIFFSKNDIFSKKSKKNKSCNLVPIVFPGRLGVV